VERSPSPSLLFRAACSLIVIVGACGPRFEARDDDVTTGAAGGGRLATAGRGGSSSGSSTGGKPSQGGHAGNATTSGGEQPGGDANAAGSVNAAGSGAAGAGASGGGSGGAAGAAGNPGAAGTAGAAGAPARCMPLTLIDDMEDGDDRSCPNQQRNGEWWTATGTTTGTIDPPTQGNFPAYALGSDRRGSSNYGMRLAGTGFGHGDADWASLGFNLIDDAAYDLSSYTGLAFYAKSKQGALPLHVEFATDTTTALAAGGACTASCNDHYSVKLSIDGAWREYSVAFDQLQQAGWGPKTKDLEHTRFVYFGFLGTDGGAASFDFLIDDVRLY
jgi:hypothetical protein